MRVILAILITFVVGCGSTVTPTPIIIVATSAPASTPGANPADAPNTVIATPTPPAPTPGPTPSASVLAAVSTVAIPKITVKVPGATAVRYFAIVGESPDDLILQTVKKSKPFCKTRDTLACVLNSAKARWIETTNRATGSCKVTSETVSLKSTVSLPRWTGPARVQPALVSWWRKMVAHLAWHEGQHIKIQRSYDSRLRSLLVGHKCSASKAIVKKWERSLDVAQKAFDTKDRSWPYPVYTGPVG